MKKTSVTGLLAAAAGLLVFMSHSSGPANNGAGNRTGSNGSVADCAGSGCHSANNPATEIFPDAIDRTPGFNNNHATSWTPGHTYEITVYARNADTTLNKFGYQISCINAAGAMMPAGNIYNYYPAAGRITTINGIQLVEHTATLDAPYMSSSLAGYNFSIYWTPPPAGSGTVKFYTTLIGVNGDSTANGDEANNSVFSLSEQGMGIRNLRGKIALSVYPVPATETVNIQLSSAAMGQSKATVYSMTGSVQQRATFTGNKTTLNIAALSSGSYVLVIANEQGHGVATFTK